MEKRLSYIVQITFFSLPIILHLFCLVVLYKSRQSRLQTNRRLYLTNLSFSELFLTIAYLTRRILLIQGVPFESRAFYCLEILQNGGFFLWYMLVMTALTIDRFLEIYLNIRYDVLWSVQKTLLILWGCFLAPCVLVVVYFTRFNDYHVVRYYNSVYLWPIVEFIATAIAVPIYFYITRRVKRNLEERRSLRRHLSRLSRTSSATSEEAVKKRRVRDHVYLPMLLIATFIFFWIVPDQILFFANILEKKPSTPVLFIIGLLFAIGFSLDPLLYIGFSRDIRRTIVKMFHAKKDLKKNEWSFNSVKVDRPLNN